MSPKPEAEAEQAVPIEPLPPARRAKVDTARQTWIRQLVDMSRRNNLLYFRELKVGTLDLTDAPAEAMQALLQSGKADAGVPLSDLVSVARKAQSVASLNDIAARARSNFEERGLDTLFLALGLASWTAPDGGRNAAAPVLLVPIEAAQTSGRNGVWTLKRAGDVKVNDVLVHALREEHGVQLDADALVGHVLGDDEGESFDLEPVFSAVATQVARVPAFTIERRWIVGNFAFQKMAIVKDLQQLGEALARHDIVAGIAGDLGAADYARGDRTAVDAAVFDLQAPGEEFLIRDADSSQQQAIAATLRGQNGVISGPPGTGKSQTISNLIAEMVARGKTVLFVAEKRAALDVVLNRLKEANLGHLCLDCHGAELTRRHVAEQLQASIERVREAPAPDAETLHRTFVERRDRLNAHVRALHQVRQPGGLSVYSLYGRILRQPPGINSTTRLSRKVLEGLDERSVADCAQTVRELASLPGLVTRTAESAWVGAVITSPEQLRSAIERVRRLANQHWPAWESALAQLLAECPVRPPVVVAVTGGLIDTLVAIQGTLGDNNDSLFRADLPQLASALAPAKSVVGAVFATLFNPTYRRALREVRALHTGGSLSGRKALLLAKDAQEQLVAWQRVASDSAAAPRALSRLDAAAAAWSALREELQAFGAVFPEKPLDSLSLTDIHEWLKLLAGDMVTPAEVLKVHQLEQQLKQRGLDRVLEEIRLRQPDPGTWVDLLRDGWLRSCLDEIQLQDPSLPAFRGSMHDEIAAEFKRLDKERLSIAVQRVQRAHAVAAVDARNKYPAQSTLVGREAAKRSRHLPLRRLFADAPEVMLALRPCWMASPLSVSQLIPGDKPLFDLVVFDEASQVLPEDAVTALFYEDGGRSSRAIAASCRRPHFSPLAMTSRPTRRTATARRASRASSTSCRRFSNQHGRSTGTIAAATRR